MSATRSSQSFPYAWFRAAASLRLLGLAMAIWTRHAQSGVSTVRMLPKDFWPQHRAGIHSLLDRLRAAGLVRLTVTGGAFLVTPVTGPGTH